MQQDDQADADHPICAHFAVFSEIHSVIPLKTPNIGRRWTKTSGHVNKLIT